MKNDKLWGGKFSQPTNKLFNDFDASIDYDKEMAAEDIEGSIAHVKMLKDAKIIPVNDANKIKDGLNNLKVKLDKGQLKFNKANEDIHMNIEAMLTDEIGDVAGKLHTGRSRNDQVALDLHLYMKKRLPIIIKELSIVQRTLINLAQNNIETIMPGYTHLQHAQPISYAHYLMAYYQMLKRDKERLKFNQKHVDVSPLGAAALAGTTFPIEPQFTAKKLGFSKIFSNSLDAVSDRDFAIEFLSNISILMMHLSRFCEELSMWVSYEFNYIELSDAYTTGSSIMPQKKNPDMAELIRGKTGRIYGHLMGLLSTMKSTPLAYNKDLQEDKEGVFDTMKTIIPLLKIFNGMINTIKVHKDKMKQSIKNDYSNATELADYLASKGMPFRKAHSLTGQLVGKLIPKGKFIQNVPLKELQKISPLIEKDIYNDLEPETAVNRRNSPGGTSFIQVKTQIKQAKEELKSN